MYENTCVCFCLYERGCAHKSQRPRARDKRDGRFLKRPILRVQIIVFGDKIVMVLELAGHGDLLEYIKLRGALDERRSRRLTSQIVSAIEYLHARNVVHR